MQKIILISLIIILLAFGVSGYFYNQAPDKIASHWNTRGEVDSYMSKQNGLFLMPLLSIIFLLLFLILPQIDPLQKNFASFKKYYKLFILILICFLFYLHLITLFWNLDYFRINIIQALSPAFAILFFIIGIILPKTKKNWFIGIRNPWTLSSNLVWDKTHILAGRLFKISGIIILTAILLPNYALFFILTPISTCVIYSFIYSYLEFRKLKVYKAPRSF